MPPFSVQSVLIYNYHPSFVSAKISGRLKKNNCVTKRGLPKQDERTALRGIVIMSIFFHFFHEKNHPQLTTTAA